MDSARNQNAILAALAENRTAVNCVTLDTLTDITGIGRKQVSTAASDLISRGLAERKERGSYHLTAAGVEAAETGRPLASGPRGPVGGRTKSVRGSFRQRLWQAMRLLRKFTTSDLLPLARSDRDKNPENNAKRYMKGLVRAGYLHVFRDRVPDGKPTSNGLIRYSLIRNSGPDAPILRTDGNEVFDPNAEKTYALAAKGAP